jgi:hypothetical protein
VLDRLSAGIHVNLDLTPDSEQDEASSPRPGEINSVEAGLRGAANEALKGPESP